MREFIYYSAKARTSGNWKDLMSAGRMDIVCNVIIQAFFISHQTRDDVHLHLIFDGPPNSPMHLEFISNKDMSISKKDVGGLIKRMLYKCSEKRKTEVFPGCFIEKKSLSGLLKELTEDKKTIQVLDGKGEKLRDVKDLKNSVFLIGDHEGLPKKELKRYKDRISIGPIIYFASQTFVIIHNEMDMRNI